MRTRFRLALGVGLVALAAAPPSPAQVQTIGDVSFAVPDGWTYKAGSGYGAMSLKVERNYWLMAVYPSMRSSGDASEDLKAAWNRIVLADQQYRRLPPLPYYDIVHTVGYRGKRADDSSSNRATYTRLYVLEAGAAFIPVVAVSNDGMVLNTKEYVANALLGSVRLAPLKAAPIKTTVTVADLAGDWKSGLGTSVDQYNSSTGRYEKTSNSFYGAAYHIAANGAFTYQMTGMVNTNRASDSDSGIVELGGEFVTFRGHNHVVRYRFLNLQQALDGSTILTLLPPGDLSHI